MGLLPELEGRTLSELVALLDGEPAAWDGDSELWFEEVAERILAQGHVGRDVLLRYLRDPSPARRGAVLAVLAAGPPVEHEVDRAIQDALEGDDPRLVVTAIDSLRHIGAREAIDQVLLRATHRSGLVRGAVLRYMADLHPAEATSLLHDGLQDADPIVRQSAIDALGEQGQPSELAHIAPLVEDPDADVRLAAETAIADLRRRQGDRP